eukprot:8306137-Alexandrium_andersonii.AAC.1
MSGKKEPTATSSSRHPQGMSISGVISTNASKLASTHVPEGKASARNSCGARMGASLPTGLRAE